MIDKQEIDGKANELGVHVANVQRDYVFGWLLAGLAQAENRLRPSLILKGGNCFRKAYFEHARFSNDLDFSTQTELDPNTFVEGLSQACSFAGEEVGLSFWLIKTAFQSDRWPMTKRRFMKRAFTSRAFMARRICAFESIST